LTDGWLDGIKFDSYSIQMRIENGAVTLKTKAGLDGQQPATATPAANLPDAIIDGETGRLRSQRD